jgi:DinB superfamily
MPPEELQPLLAELSSTQEQICDLLEPLADDQDWQPRDGEWSFRFIAGHLATNERECFLERIERIASGEGPSFDYYSNDGDDFSNLGLGDWLQAWREIRQAIFERMNGLPEPAWALSGTHRSYGRITLMDVLGSMRAHDEEHLEGLNSILEKYPKQD